MKKFIAVALTLAALTLMASDAQAFGRRSCGRQCHAAPVFGGHHCGQQFVQAPTCGQQVAVPVVINNTPQSAPVTTCAGGGACTTGQCQRQTGFGISVNFTRRR